MLNRKIVFRIIFCTVIIIGVFITGYIVGHLDTNRRWTNASMIQREMANYIYKEIEENFGLITLDNKKDMNIVGYIPLYKTIGFGIIVENGVKTIKVYED